MQGKQGFELFVPKISYKNQHAMDNPGLVLVLFVYKKDEIPNKTTAHSYLMNNFSGASRWGLFKFIEYLLIKIRSPDFSRSVSTMHVGRQWSRVS